MGLLYLIPAGMKTVFVVHGQDAVHNDSLLSCAVAGARHGVLAQ